MTDGPRGHRVDPHTRAAILALAVMFISYFGFVASDRTGLGNQSADVLLNHYYRMGGLLLALAIVAYASIRYKTFSLDFGPMSILVAMYIYYGVALAFNYASNGGGSYLSLLRCIEWMAIIVITSQIRSNSSQNTIEVLFDCLKMFIKITAAICAVYVVLFRDAIVITGIERVQLGGAAIHPNRLAFIGSAGLLAFGIFGKNRADVVWYAVSLMAVLGAASRIGYLLAGIAIFLTVLSKLSATVRFLALATIGVVVIGWAGAIANFSDLSLFASLWTDELSSLNGRSDVWDIALRMAQERPIVGWGFIDGPKQIGTFVNQSWWNPTNAQGDILSSIVSGGLIGAIILLTFYGFAVSRLFLVRAAKIRIFLTGMIIIYFLSSLFESYFVHLAVHPAFLLLVCIRIGYEASGQATEDQLNNGTHFQSLPSRRPVGL